MSANRLQEREGNIYMVIKVTVIKKPQMYEGERYYWYLIARNRAAGTSVTLLSILILAIFRANRIVKSSTERSMKYYTDVRCNMLGSSHGKFGDRRLTKELE